MPRAQKPGLGKKPSTGAISQIPPKKVAASKAPKRAAKVPLVRDLVNLSEGVQRKLHMLLRDADYLSDLRQKADAVSAHVDDAKKDQEERVGKVEADIARYQLERVQTQLVAMNKEAIDKFEFRKLKELREKSQLDQNSSEKGKQKEVNEEVARQVRFHQERFERDFANWKAREASFDAERKMLHATIAGLRAEIESQKWMSSEIAKANQQHKINIARKKAIEEHQRKEDALRGVPAPAAVAPTPAAVPPVAATPPPKAAKAARKAQPKRGLQKQLSTTSATSASSTEED